MSSHSSWPGSAPGLSPIFSSIGGDTPAKKFTSAECLDALIERYTNNPEDIGNQLNLIVDSQIQQYRKISPSILDPDAWSRISTHRPTHDDEGNHLGGTDREVRVYENDVWADAGHALESTVTTEHGEIISIDTVVKW